MRWIVVALVTAVGGCGGFGNDNVPGTFSGEVPDMPTYEEHIKPIMEAACDTCHFETFLGSDRYVSTRYETMGNVQGVFESRDRLIQRTVNQSPSPMPPVGDPPLGTTDLQIIQRWVDTGGEQGTPPP